MEKSLSALVLFHVNRMHALHAKAEKDCMYIGIFIGLFLATLAIGIGRMLS